jgi:hypothetical protein
LSEAEIKKQKLLSDLEMRKQKFLTEVEKKCIDLKNRYTKEIEKIKEKNAREEEFRRGKLSRLVGENLGRYMEREFEKVRTYGFSNIQFERDGLNKMGGSKKYILREQDKEGMEIFSIIFELKDGTESSRENERNEEFFKRLDDNRNRKSCEYAVLVSMLEMDNEYYDTGIVDVSHKYPKMYVIRPNFFISLIGLLRNAALNSVEYRQELNKMHKRNIEVSNIEKELLDLKDRFEINQRLANEKYQTTISEVDQAIRNLQKSND